MICRCLAKRRKAAAATAASSIVPPAALQFNPAAGPQPQLLIYFNHTIKGKSKYVLLDRQASAAAGVASGMDCGPRYPSQPGAVAALDTMTLIHS
jgi:hypothetical protein